MTQPRLSAVSLRLLAPSGPGAPRRILVGAHADSGDAGWAVCPDAAQRRETLERLGRALLGQAPSETNRRHHALGLAGSPHTQPGDLAPAGALDNAVLDLAARAAGVPLALWLGGHVRTRVPVADRLAWADAPTALAGAARVRWLVERAGARVARHGFAALTVVADGAEPPDVIALLGALRDAFDARVALRLELITFPNAAIGALVAPARALGVAALIEPGIAASTGPDRATVPIAVSVCPPLGEILRNGIAQIVRIASPQHGGAAVAQRLAALARIYQAEVLLAGTSGLAIEAALLGQLARAMPCDLQPLDLARDPTTLDGIAITDGALVLPDGPGIGVVPDPALLTRAERLVEITP